MIIFQDDHKVYCSQQISINFYWKLANYNQISVTYEFFSKLNYCFFQHTLCQAVKTYQLKILILLQLSIQFT